MMCKDTTKEKELIKNAELIIKINDFSEVYNNTYTSGIYILRKENEDYYIGSSNDIDRRMKEHKHIITDNEGKLMVIYFNHPEQELLMPIYRKAEAYTIRGVKELYIKRMLNGSKYNEIYDKEFTEIMEIIKNIIFIFINEGGNKDETDTNT